MTGLKISGKILDGEDSSLVLGIFKQEDGELVGKTIVDKDGNYNFVACPGKILLLIQWFSWRLERYIVSRIKFYW